MRPILSILLVAAIAAPAAADDPGPLEADPLTDGAITVGAAAGALVFHFIHVNEAPDAWTGELFGSLDKGVRANYSRRARIMSDVGLVTSVALPAAFAVGTTWDEGAGDRALVFSESIGAALLLTSISKTLVGRPRPYTYNTDNPGAVHRAQGTGRDSRRSFFSGHAATAFAAFAAGGALYAGRETDKQNRAFVWGAGAMIAAATANWRVRAGEHYYSDIVVGALVGAAAGTIIPAIHTGGLYKPSGTELGAIAGGLVLGAALSQLVPLGDTEAPSRPGKLQGQLTPLVLPSGGGGMGVVGTF